MKHIFLLYNKCCLYEIVTLNYFLNFSGCEVIFCSLDGKPVRTMEGYQVMVDMPLSQVDVSRIGSFVVPGGKISEVNTSRSEAFFANCMGRAYCLQLSVPV